VADEKSTFNKSKKIPLKKRTLSWGPGTVMTIFFSLPFFADLIQNYSNAANFPQFFTAFRSYVMSLLIVESILVLAQTVHSTVLELACKKMCHIR
jgi:hypothetical protein